jgi:uncharacterized protein YfaS (alpha-2-macroglobulin family)
MLRWTLSTLGFVLIACSRASTPLPAKQGKPIAIAPRRTAAQQGFSVVFSGPTGATAPESEIQILFSRPVRALTTIEQATPPEILLRPAIEGSWHWLGTQALVFSPARKRLPFGTEISVEVPASLRALDGMALGQAHRFTLQTPPPKVERVHTDDDATHLRERSQFALAFDQPVALEALRQHARLEVTRADKTERWPVAVSTDPAEPDRVFRVVPQKPLPMAASVHLVIGAGLVGTEGPLPSTSDQVNEFSTLQPLRIVDVTCEGNAQQGKCDSRSGIDIEFNNPVLVRQLRSHLTIDGKPAKLAGWYSDQETTAYMHLTGPFQAGTEVELRVSPGVKDEYGQALREGYARRLRFDNFTPKMEIGVEGEVFETAQPTSIPIGSVNVGNYDRIGSVLDVPRLMAALTAETADERWAKLTDSAGVHVQPVKSQRFANQLAVEWFDPAGTKAGWLGPALIGVRYAGLDAEGNPTTLTDTRVVQRTNLGISGQIGKWGSVVWVTTLDRAEAVTNAEVSLVSGDGSVVERASTDTDGLARFGSRPLPDDVFGEQSAQYAFIVKKDADWSYRRVSDAMPEWRIPVSVDRAGQLGSRVMLFTERGLYRPGERVDVKAVIRDEQPRGLTLPKRRDLTLELTAPDNHVVATKAVKLSEFGTSAASFGVPVAAATGQWSVRARYDKEAIGSAELTVGEYRPVELEVSVEPAKREILRGGQLAVAISARTLFGMAAAKAETRVEAYRERTQFTPPGADAYVTDAYAFEDTQANATFSRAQLTLLHRALDQAGQLNVSVPTDLPAARGPEWIEVEAEVKDATENPVAKTARTLVHPASDYVGLKRLENTWLNTPSRLPVAVASFGIDGTRRIGRVVDVELVRRTWAVVRREINGTVQSQNQATDSVVERCQVKTAAADVLCQFTVAKPGSYFVVARSKDEAQRVASSAQSFFATGAGQPEIADTDDRQIELTPDKAEYRVGDVAKILVKSAITNVDALVTVGRSELHVVERRHLTGTTPILEIPIREDMRPNMFVAVHLVTGRKRAAPTQIEKPDLGAPTYRTGWAELRIGSEERRLTVELKPSTRQARPGDNVEFALTVLDREQRPVRGEVTLWAVDEGVLALGGYQVPDPYQIFLGSRPLQWVPIESREALGRRTLASLREELGLSKGNPGGGGGESAPGVGTRQDFRSTAFFLPDLHTDAAGRVRATMRLPDGLTTYRVFAVAVAGTDQYGFAGDRIVTSKSLMLRPVVPRFFREGDRADLSVLVASKDAPDGEGIVKCSATGLLPKQQSQAAKIVRGGSVELTFPVEAAAFDSNQLAESVAATSLSLELTSGAARDAVKLQRPLRRAVPMEVVAQAGETTDRVLEQIGDLSATKADQGYLELRLSNSFLGASAGGFKQLIDYPYGCSEQLSSRLLALLPLADLAKLTGVELPKERDKLIEIAIGELVRRQRYDGGFVMWDGAGRTEPFVTAHVLAALNEAQRSRPYLKPVIARGAEYLRHLGSAQPSELEAPAALAYVADVLYRLHAGDPALLTRLYEKRQQLPEFAQALLLHAYALANHDSAATQELVAMIERLLHSDGASAHVATNLRDGYARLFDSNTRTEAMVLWALASARPDHPLLVPLARGLLAAQRDGRWSTTQEAAFALMALDNVRRQKHLSPEAMAAAVQLGERKLFDGALGGKSPPSVTTLVPMGQLQQAGGKLLVSTDRGPLLYEARLHYVPRQPNDAALDAGFTLERRFWPVLPDGTLATEAVAPDPGRPCVLQAQRGQSFVVEHTVVVPRPRDFVALDSPIPAGFEAIDIGHRTSSKWMQHIDRVDGIGPGTSGLEFHRDLRDDRAVFLVDHFPIGLYRLRYLVRAVTRGDYALPAARVEAMYAPEVFGLTSTCRVSVK